MSSRVRCQVDRLLRKMPVRLGPMGEPARRRRTQSACEAPPHFQRVEDNAFHLVFLFVHKKRIALTVPTIVIIRTNLLAAGVLCLTFVGSMRAQQSPAERVAEIQAALRFLNAERFGTILAVQPLIAFLSQRQKWLR